MQAAFQSNILIFMEGNLYMWYISKNDLLLAEKFGWGEKRGVWAAGSSRSSTEELSDEVCDAFAYWGHVRVLQDQTRGPCWLLGMLQCFAMADPQYRFSVDFKENWLFFNMRKLIELLFCVLFLQAEHLLRSKQD